MSANTPFFKNHSHAFWNTKWIIEAFHSTNHLSSLAAYHQGSPFIFDAFSRMAAWQLLSSNNHSTLHPSSFRYFSSTIFTAGLIWFINYSDVQYPSFASLYTICCRAYFLIEGSTFLASWYSSSGGANYLSLSLINQTPWFHFHLGIMTLVRTLGCPKSGLPEMSNPSSCIIFLLSQLRSFGETTFPGLRWGEDLSPTGETVRLGFPLIFA